MHFSTDPARPPDLTIEKAALQHSNILPKNYVQVSTKLSFTKRNRSPMTSITSKKRTDPQDLHETAKSRNGEKAGRERTPVHCRLIRGLRQREARLHISNVEHHVREPNQERCNSSSGRHLGKRSADHFQQTDFFHANRAWSSIVPRRRKQ